MEFDEAALQEVRERRLLINQYDAWLFEPIEPFIGQRVLEVGCGLGNLIHHLLDRELVVGIDISEESVEHINKTYGHHRNVHAVTCDVTGPDLVNLKRYRFDTAVSLNVLEHIEDDVFALEQIFEVLVPGGRLVLIVPAHMGLYGTMDRSIGHFRRYTCQDLAAKLHQAGFEITRQKYINPIGALGWFVNGRILRRKVPPIAQLKLFDRVMPLVIALASRLEMPLGLSLLSISERVG